MTTGRRTFLKLLISGMGAAAGGGLLTASAGAAKARVHGPVADRKVRAMDFTVRHITEIVNLPKRGTAVELWAPLPESDDEQEITELSIRSPVAFEVNEEPGYGNAMIHTLPARLKSGDRFTLSCRIRRKAAGTIRDAGDEKKHLVLTERERWDGNIARFVDEATAGENDPLETGRKIYHALVDYLTYDRDVPGCGQGISAWTFEQRRGKCDDFHALMRTMLVYKGIPARWEQGVSLPYPSAIAKSGAFEGDCTGAHCWLRFHAGGAWVPVDVSEAAKRKDLRDYFFGTLSPNRFKVSTGRDVVLSPSSAGGPLNTFYGAHVESEGVPLIYGHNYRNIIRYELLNMEMENQ